jgi:hypothetical protein
MLSRRNAASAARTFSVKSIVGMTRATRAYLTIGTSVSADVLILTVLSAAALALAMNLGAGPSGASGSHGCRDCNSHAPESTAQASDGVAFEMKATPSTAKVRASPIVIPRLGNNR